MGNAQSDSEIRLDQAIGEGSYAEVFKAVWHGKPVAAKRIRAVFFENDPDGNQRQAFLQRYKREWEILSALNHPNIVKYYTVLLPPSPATPIIVTELLHQDLAHLLRASTSTPRIAFSDVVKIMLDVAEGLKYLHAQKPKVVHRDLASKNVLLTRDKQAKIADMGLAKAFPHGAMWATAVPGTPIYAAPETYPRRNNDGYRSQTEYTEKIDIFSYGALLLEVIVGHLPNYLPDPVLPGGEVIPEYCRRSEDLEEMGPDHPLHGLVLGCLENEPELRPSAESIADQLRKFAKDAERQQVSGSPPSCGAFAPHHDHKFKIVVLGESGVGKTCIVKRFLNPDALLSDQDIPGTIEPGEHFQRLQYRGKSVHVHIVDTAGQGRFGSAENLVPQVFRRVRGALVVFDVTSQLSFLEVPNWIRVARERCGDDVIIVLVGNKTDEGDRWVTAREASTFADKHDVFYIESSAKRNENIDELFSHLLSLLVQDQQARRGGNSSAAQLTADGPAPITGREMSPRHVFVPEYSITLDKVDLQVGPGGEDKNANLTVAPPIKKSLLWSRCCASS